MLRSVKKDDDTYWSFSTKDPSGNIVPAFLNGDKNGHAQKLEGATKRLAALIRKKYPGLLFEARRTEGFLSINFKEFVQVTVTPDKTDFVWNPVLAIIHKLQMPELKKELLEGEASSGVRKATPGISSLPFFLFKAYQLYHLEC